MNVIYSVKLNVSEKNVLKSLILKQNDSNSRFIDCAFMHGRFMLLVRTGTVVLNVTRADGQHKSFAGTINDNGTVRIPVANWMVENAGMLDCDVSVYDGDEKLTSALFSAEVQASANPNGSVSPDDPAVDMAIVLIDRAEAAAAEAKSWAVGGTGTRTGEDTDNAMYYKDLAEQAVQGGIVDPTVTEWLETKSDHIDGVIEDEVDEWLDDHPEATTTVEDRSITPKKLNAVLAKYIFDESETPTELPSAVQGDYDVQLSAGSEVISGTHNCAGLLDIKPGEYTVSGVTFNVSDNVILITGTANANITYSLADGSSKTTEELAAMTLPLPVTRYTLSNLVTDVAENTSLPTLCIRKKPSASTGTVITVQNNVAEFDMSNETCGGLYFYLISGRSYHCKVTVGLFPYSATTSEPHRSEISNVNVIDESGFYTLNGYAWSVGTASANRILAPVHKPFCKYTASSTLTKATEQLDVYIPTRTGYVRYCLAHGVFAAANADLWKVYQIDAIGKDLSFLYHITTIGELEMALKINGRTDFIGGIAHGDEVMESDSVICMLDGAITDISSLTSFTEFDKLQMFCITKMYDPNDGTTQVGEHSREWEFTKAGLLLNQTVSFQQNLTLNESFMPMLCAVRGNDATSEEQITDTYIDDGNFRAYDVGTSGFTGYPTQRKPDVRTVHLCGADSKLEITLDVINQPNYAQGQGAWLYNGDAYNKIYCTVCGYGASQNVVNGDKWHVKTRINVDIGE